MPRNFQVLYGDDSQMRVERFAWGETSAAIVVRPPQGDDLHAGHREANGEGVDHRETAHHPAGFTREC